MPPEVSVILPFFNAGKTLAAAIESILQQTFNNFELLLIDNNSTDTSKSIARKFAEKDHRIRLFSEEKQGVAHAMNCGLKNARGRFVARMDADDISLPERMEKQVDFKKWSEKQNRFHPDIWVWGAGRKTRQRAKLLEKEGLKIQGFIDIVKGKTTEND